LESYDNDNNLVSRVIGKEIGHEIESYSVITTISGVITEIGSKTLHGKTHIEIHDLGYRIFTTPEQDIALKSYYRARPVTFKIKQKIGSKKNRVASASLLDFKPSSKGSLMENLSALTQDALLMVKDIHSHEEVLRLIRET
jgi:hypothetical protein